MATPVQKQKLAEAQNFVKEAEKSKKPGLFGWKKPDWESTSANYGKAAQAYKLAKSWELAVENFRHAADACDKCDLWSSAATHFDNAAQIASKELKDTKKAAGLYKEGAAMYTLAGSPEQAANLLLKAAKEMESGNSPTDVLEMYSEGLAAYEESQKWHYVSDSYRNAAQFAVKINNFPAAADFYLRYNKACEGMGDSHNAQAHKNFLSAIILYLADNKYELADKTYQDGTEYPAFGHSEPSKAAADILDAWEKCDQDLLTAALAQNKTINFLDQWIVRLTKTLKAPQEDAFGISGASRPVIEKLDLNLRSKEPKEPKQPTREDDEPQLRKKRSSTENPKQPQKEPEAAENKSSSEEKPEQPENSEKSEKSAEAAAGEESAEKSAKSASDSEEDIL